MNYWNTTPNLSVLIPNKIMYAGNTPIPLGIHHKQTHVFVHDIQTTAPSHLKLESAQIFISNKMHKGHR